MFHKLAGAILLLVSISVMSVSAQRATSVAARVVVIKPKEGMQKQFEEGYKRHLEWHRRNKDEWTWYGWQIVGGERLGYFMDGTFGHRWEDFDAPVSPGEDAADNAINVAPYADFVALGHYVLRPELSRGNLLEEKVPSPFVEMLSFHVRPGREREFEEVLRAIHRALEHSNPKPRHTWYQLVNGGELSTYILFLPLNKLSDLQFWQNPLTSFLKESSAPRQAQRLIGLLESAVRDVRSETLRYRADLSYFPTKD